MPPKEFTMLGTWELLIVLLIVLLIFGAGKLPQIGDALGRSIKNFRRSASGNDEIEVSKQESLNAGDRNQLDSQARDAEVVGSESGDHRRDV